jgi:AraC-like DNA-binding protein
LARFFQMRASLMRASRDARQSRVFDAQTHSGTAPLCLLAFVRPELAPSLKAVAPRGRLRLAGSWTELECCLHAGAFTAVALDYAADGAEKLDVAAALIRAFPATPFFGYVPLSPGSLKAVFALSKSGLVDAFPCPLEDPERVRKTLDKFFANTLASEMVRLLEPGLAHLPEDLRNAVFDLFQRPHLYGNAVDLALAGHVSVRALFRWFRAANLGNPKKLVVAARLLRAYGYFRARQCSIEEVSERVGYPSPRALARHSIAGTGCRPSRLARAQSCEAVVCELLDWIYKPTLRTQRQSKPATSRDSLTKRNRGIAYEHESSSDSLETTSFA